MKITRILLILIMGFSVVFALNVPKASKYDAKITFTTYNANDVFEIKCANGFVSVIKFSDDENIINIATGFSAGWDINDRNNYLFIKPKAYAIVQAEQNLTSPDGQKIEFNGASFIQPNPKDWKTNLIITTNKRDYTFELVIEQEKPFYKISFSYPDEQKIKVSKAEIKKKELENKQNLKKELEKTRVPKNWDFIAHVNKNSDDIAPDFAYDDGVFTYLGFWHTKTIPSVFNFDENDEESLLNTHIKKDGNYDVVVVHKLSKRILLRSGQKLVGVFNKGYGKNPLKQPQNTISNKVEREIIKDNNGTR